MQAVAQLSSVVAAAIRVEFLRQNSFSISTARAVYAANADDSETNSVFFLLQLRVCERQMGSEFELAKTGSEKWEVAWVGLEPTAHLIWQQMLSFFGCRERHAFFAAKSFV